MPRVKSASARSAADQLLEDALIEDLPPDRFCIRCGKRGPWRDDAALKCIECDASTKDDRAAYQKNYQKAKSRALKELVKRHKGEFDGLLKTERLKIHRERKSA